MLFFSLIQLFLHLYLLIIIARVLLSWFPNLDRHEPMVRVIFGMTEPVLRPVRNILPYTGIPLDFSALVVAMIVQVLIFIVPG
ncbi:MAG: YggT family protein [Armatimonadetes bacterium]|nr:YggT family protein [Anaerolineae bacterium]